MLGSDLAIDFGSVSTRVANAKGKVIYEQPTIVALDHESGKPVFYGAAALGSPAQGAGQLLVVHPVEAGQFENISVAELFLKHVIEQTGRDFLRRRRVLATIPLDATPVQLRATASALERAGVHKTRFLAQPLASALGANVAIEAPVGSMVVDMGGEITNLAAVALGGVIIGSTVHIGGESLVRALAHEFLARDDLVVGPEIARQIRDEFGVLGETEENVRIEIVGRDRSNGELRTIAINNREISGIFLRELTSVLDSVSKIIAESPPEISNDLMTSGIVLAGGGSQLRGFAQVLAKAAGVPIHVFERPERLGVLGASRCLSSFQELEDSFMAASPR